MRAPAAVALLTLLGVLAGCTPCKESCRIESRRFEDCLGEWGLEWVDVGATGRVNYRETCVGDVDVWLDGLEAEERSQENQQCAAANTALRESEDCAAVWDALVEYGAL